jgi:hypothetical protein
MEKFFRRFGLPDFDNGMPQRHHYITGQGSGFFISPSHDTCSTQPEPEFAAPASYLGLGCQLGTRRRPDWTERVS